MATKKPYISPTLTPTDPWGREVLTGVFRPRQVTSSHSPDPFLHQNNNNNTSSSRGASAEISPYEGPSYPPTQQQFSTGITRQYADPTSVPFSSFAPPTAAAGVSNNNNGQQVPPWHGPYSSSQAALSGAGGGPSAPSAAGYPLRSLTDSFGSGGSSSNQQQQQQQGQGPKGLPSLELSAARYKTKMCKNWEQQGSCPISNCQFAHGPKELRTKQLPQDHQAPSPDYVSYTSSSKLIDDIQGALWKHVRHESAVFRSYREQNQLLERNLQMTEGARIQAVAHADDLAKKMRQLRQLIDQKTEYAEMLQKTLEEKGISTEKKNNFGGATSSSIGCAEEGGEEDAKKASDVNNNNNFGSDREEDTSVVDVVKAPVDE